MVGGTHIKRRHVALPVDELLELRGHARRQAEYTRAALPLCEETAREALRLAGVAGRDIDAIVPVSCTGYLMPSLDAYLVNRLGLNPAARRVPITELGCSAGAAALGLASELLRSGGTALVLSVELCSLCMENDEPSASDLLGRILFADGAAAAVVSSDPSDGPSIVASRSVLIPDSLGLLQTLLSDSGFRLGLSPSLPSLLGESLRAATDSFLAGAGVALADMEFFAIHPGGPKILEAVEHALELRGDALRPSWDVLEQFGNMSSSSIFFVLHRLQQVQEPREDSLGLAVAFGPGVTCEFLLLRWRRLTAMHHAPAPQGESPVEAQVSGSPRSHVAPQSRDDA